MNAYTIYTSDAEQGPLRHLRFGLDADEGAGLPDRRPVQGRGLAHRAESLRDRRRQRQGGTGTGS